MLLIDFETRSRVDLLTAGAYTYASDPSTKIICMGWWLGDGRRESGVWFPATQPIPKRVRDYVTKTEGLVAAHNANFDRLIWEALMHESLQLPLSRWYCTAAQCRVNALPASLGDATRALFGANRKDIRGPQLIKLLSIPRDDGTFNTDPKLIQEMGEYCLQDIRAMKDVMDHSRLMYREEHRAYLDNEMINDDGIRIDRELANLATKEAEAETQQLAEKLVDLTRGHITKHTQVQRIRDWVIPRLDEDAKKMTRVHKKDEVKTSLDKNVRARLLDAAETNVIDMDPTTKQVLQILDDGNKSSVAKFKRMLERRSPEDDRVRGSFVFAGASQTLRYASRGLQLHNFTRGCLTPTQTATVKRMLRDGEPLIEPMTTLARMLRPTLVPAPGCRLIVGDWSSIEARALPWLTKDSDAEDRLDLFARDGDIYQLTSDRLHLNDRQLGKVAELSLGYGGANGAFNAMARNYGVALPDDKITQLVESWRRSNRWAVNFWDKLERAARNAVARPGVAYGAGRVSYTFYPNLINGTLVCTLPGGATIQYPRCKLETTTTKYGERTALTALKANWKPAAGEKEWPRVTLWRGLLAENVTQAFCAQLLRDAIHRCLREGLPVVAHVHDEIVSEVNRKDAEIAARDQKTIMEEVPSWATGLPLKAEQQIMTRYGK